MTSFFTSLSPLSPKEGSNLQQFRVIMEVSCGTVWNDCLEVIRINVEEENFNTWFKPITPVRVAGEVLTIQVPSQFLYEWIDENSVAVLKQAINTVLGTFGILEY